MKIRNWRKNEDKKLEKKDRKITVKFENEQCKNEGMLSPFLGDLNCNVIVLKLSYKK
jgi:hypothetical protein